jgi:phospholipase/carboxylesterase
MASHTQILTPAPLSLTHVLRAPRPTVDGAAPPLLILLHGVGSNELSMAPLAAGLDDRFLVISARSPIALGPNAFGWFHVQFTPQGSVIDAAEAAAGWAAIARFIDEAIPAYGADPARVYVAGFSQGGIMALAAMLTAPGKIAGAVCMSGRLLPEVLPHAAPAPELNGKPVLLVHGTRDEKLGVHLARTARENLLPLGVDLAYHELEMGHTITEESVGIVRGWLSARLGPETAA